jgi:hypothetical protein
MTETGMGKWRSALTLVVLTVLLTSFLPVAHAFHQSDTGFCEGCHSLHAAKDSDQPLLHGIDASSTCLRCHAQVGEWYSVLSNDGSSFTPGGDFYWLTRSYGWREVGRTHVSPGESHGHNVVALEFDMNADSRVSVAPGGRFQASSLSCISCHDPHARVPAEDEGAAGSYRLLAGRGYRSSGAVFSTDAPVALAPSVWNETDTNHVDYGSGMSEWCANCHEDMLGDNPGKHPAGAAALFSPWTARAYGEYIRSGDFSGNPEVSYLALVPFERGVFEQSGLDPTSTAGPNPDSSNVMCLTCHRAHASAFRSMGRWDFSATFLADSLPGPSDGGADAVNAYYGRDIVSEFGPYQRSLCNKCHVKD